MSDPQLAQWVSRKCRYRKRQPVRGPYNPSLLFSGCIAVALLSVLVGASRQIGSQTLRMSQKSVLRSALAQTPDCQSMSGVSVDPIASAIPGTMLLESEGWRVGNLDDEPLVIRSVTINDERLAPLGVAACGHVKRHNDRHYPVTVGSGESVAIFGYAVGDRASYCNPVNHIVLDTNRGQFRYSPTAGLEPQ